jgi:alpha-beta hydrolase superfamily lysophospholipase
MGALAVFGMRAFQQHLVYVPDRSPMPPAASVLPGASDVQVDVDGLTLTSWFVPPAPGAPARDMAVLLAHGNGGSIAGPGGNLTGRTFLAQQLAERGFAVMLVGYRGYGGNPGTPSEQGLIEDARAALGALGERGYPTERVIFFGESVGTGVVTGLARDLRFGRLSTGEHPAGLVLRSPFTSLHDTARSLVPLPAPVIRFVLNRNTYPLAEQLGRFPAGSLPTTVLYGTADTVVPSAQSAEVATIAESSGNLVEVIVIDGAGHNDGVWSGAVVADAVAHLADSLDGGGGPN